MTEKLARLAGRHPGRVIAAWSIVLLLSIVVLALLLPSALTTD